MLKKETLNLLENVNFKDIFSICIGKTYINQKRFIEYIGKYYKWNTDVKKGILQIDYKKFDVEYIGTTSKSDNYWYSAEVEQVIPNKYKKIIKSVKKEMEKINIKEISSSKIPLKDEINGYNLSMIYIAFAKENLAYFNGSGDTSIYMFVKKLPKELFRRMTASEFSASVMEIIGQFVVDHKLLVKALLIENDYPFEEEENKIIAKFSEKSVLAIEFNKISTKISGYLN